jgi:hypothetical protein
MARTAGATSRASTAPQLQRIWQSMRVLRRFTAAELQAAAAAGKSQVGKYLSALKGAKIVRIAQPRVSGRPGSYDVWQLVRDLGPLAPILRKDGAAVFDPNGQRAWAARGPRAGEPVDATPMPRLALAQRQTLRLLSREAACHVNADTLHVLLRHGLVTVQVSLTDAGRRLAESLPAPRTQRDPGPVAAEVRHAAA